MKIWRSFIKLFPSKDQWNKWTLPSRYAAIGILISLFALVLSITFYSSDRSRSSNNSAIFKTAMSYYKNENFNKAIDLFSVLIEKEPDYPNAAYNYGKTLQKAKRHQAAIEAWELVPHTETHNDLNYLRGMTYRDLADSQKAVYYLERAREELNRADKFFYWRNEAILLETKYEKKSIKEFAYEVNMFCNRIDKLNVQAFTAVGGLKEIRISDINVEEVFSQKLAAFYLLHSSSARLIKQKMYSSSLNSMLRIVKYLQGSGLLFRKWGLEKNHYETFMTNLSLAVGGLHSSSKQLPSGSELVKALVDIEKHNEEQNHLLADMAMIMRGLYGDLSNQKRTRVGGFILSFKRHVQHPKVNNLITAHVNSPSFFGGKHSFELSGDH